VAGYNVLRNGSVAGTTASLYYQDTGLTESTAYTYTVEAFDLAGNTSAPSLRISVTTADVTPPSIPAGLTAIASSCLKVTLAWTASTDKVGVGSYIVFWGISPAALSQIGRTPATVTAYTSYPLTCGTTYYYGVEAVDTSGNASAMSTIIAVTTPQPPAAPSSVSASSASAYKIGVTWSAAASGGLPVQYYHVFRGSTASSLGQVAIVSQTSYTDNSLNPATAYCYAVESADTGSDLSAMSAVVCATTPTPPAAPTNLAATPSSTSNVSLTWSAAAGGGLPIQNYHIYRGTTSSNLSQLAIVLQTSYSDNSVTAGARYYYAVAAADSGADLSPLSAIVAVTMPCAPSAPTGLQATPTSTSRIGLAWSTAVSGGLPIQNYHVYRGATSSSLSPLTIVLQTSYSDTTVTPGAVYYYAVAAADSGSDLSPMSAVVSVTVPVGPSAPAGLVATPVSTTKIGLTWSVPPCGGLPIRNYAVFRGATASSLSQLATVTQPLYTDASGSPSTTYYYAIQAIDTGGDVSKMSAAVPATTLALPSAPTNLVATAPNKVQVNLTWTTALSGMPLASYTIFRGSSPSSLASLKVVLATQTSSNDTTVTPGVTYYYGMQSKDTLGNVSPMSAVVSVTTP
jgi:fibronectin type 3 domain-containing protein